MDLDTALLRSFVVTADERHFARAAARLYVSQQALSKRIQRLEELLGVRLLDRTNRRVDITEAGSRLLPAARRAVDSVDAAVAAVRAGQRAVRVDVLDEHLAPLQLVHQAVERDPSLRVDVVMRGNLRELVPGLRDGDFDIAFGRAGAVDPPWPADVNRRLVLLEPVALMVGAGHPLATRHEVPLPELREHALWFPMTAAPGEWTTYLDELSDQFGLDIDYSGSTMGMPYFLERIASDPRRATFLGMAMPLPPDERISVVPIVSPAPLFPWSALWRRQVPTYLVDALVAGAVADLAGQLAFARDPDQAWLPQRDRAHLPR